MLPVPPFDRGARGDRIRSPLLLHFYKGRSDTAPKDASARQILPQESYEIRQKQGRHTLPTIASISTTKAGTERS
jgi:hypothetical protein